jgi:hypothetical protein
MSRVQEALTAGGFRYEKVWPATDASSPVLRGSLEGLRRATGDT